MRIKKVIHKAPTIGRSDFVDLISEAFPKKGKLSDEETEEEARAIYQWLTGQIPGSTFDEVEAFILRGSKLLRAASRVSESSRADELKEALIDLKSIVRKIEEIIK